MLLRMVITTKTGREIRSGQDEVSQREYQGLRKMLTDAMAEGKSYYVAVKLPSGHEEIVPGGSIDSILLETD